MIRRLLSLALALLLAACAARPAAQPEISASSGLQPLFAEFWEESLALHPLQATSVGDNRYNDRLPNTGRGNMPSTRNGWRGSRPSMRRLSVNRTASAPRYSAATSNASVFPTG